MHHLDNMSLPTLVFVPGAWHSPSTFHLLFTHLEPHGYKCIGVDLPSNIDISSGPPSSPPQSHDPDINAIRTAIVTELDLGPNTNVVLITHSYGLIPSTAAITGLSKSSRAAQGKSNGVVALGMMTSLILPAGISMLGAGGGKPSPWHDVRGEMLLIGPPGPEYLFYNDLPEMEAKHHVGSLKAHTLAMHHAEIKVGLGDIDLTGVDLRYLVCTKDQAIPPQFQWLMIEGANKNEGVNISTEECESGHSPFLSQPEFTVGWVRRVAGEDTAEKS